MIFRMLFPVQHRRYQTVMSVIDQLQRKERYFLSEQPEEDLVPFRCVMIQSYRYPPIPVHLRHMQSVLPRIHLQ